MYDLAQDVDRLISAATAAPSVLNTQPWFFQVVASDRINLLANPERWLRHTDGEGRELAISCGAALFNLRMALRVVGHDPNVCLKLDRGDFREALEKAKPPERTTWPLLASVEIVTTRVHPPTATEQGLYEAIPWRHTNRQPFEKKPVGLNLVAELEQVAWLEQAYLWLLHKRMTRRLLRGISAANAAEKQSEPGSWGAGFQPELEEYTNEPRLSQGLGIPNELFGPLPKNVRYFRHDKDTAGAPKYPGVPYRDLGFKWHQPTGPDSLERERRKFEKHTRLLALATDTNTAIDWLRAGQGLQRVLLTATCYKLAASFYTQPLEQPNANGRPPHPPWKQGRPPWWPWPKFPQMIIRLGYCNYTATGKEISGEKAAKKNAEKTGRRLCNGQVWEFADVAQRVTT